MTQNPALGVIVAVAVAMLGCSAGEPSEVNSSDGAGDTIRLPGRLNDEMVRKLEAEFSPATRRLVVNSAGGRGTAAMRIADIANSRNLEVVVDGVCLSACAHFLFLPAKKRALARNSVVAFHRTATSIHRALVAAGRRDLAETFAPLAREEAQFYARAGLSEDALVVPFNEVQPICYAEDRRQPASSEYRTRIYFVHEFYTPSLTQLKSWGVRDLSGKWPTSLQEVARAVPRYGRPLRGSFKVALKEDVPRNAGVKALPACSTESLAPSASHG